MLLLFLRWKFFDSNLAFFNAWADFLVFGFRIFSMPLIIKTFLTPWHKYYWTPNTTGIDIGAILNVSFGNLMSIIIGIILRTFFIVFGLLFVSFMFVIGGFLFVLWFALPFLAAYFLYEGIVFLIV